MQITKLTAEQNALADVARGVLSKQSDPAHVRQLTETRQHYDRDLWKTAGQLGWHGLETPADRGGSDQTFLETSLVLRELGRATTPGPYLSQQLALHALNSQPEHPIARRWTEGLAQGDHIGAVILGTLDRQGRIQPAFRGGASTASTLTLGGKVTDVPDVGCADIVIVAATIDDLPAIVAVPLADIAFAITWRATHDRTRALYDVEATNTQVDRAAILATGAQAQTILIQLWQRAATGIALDAAGGASKAVELTVNYTSQRVQYGRVIATFQAVKHTCADMFVESETARIAADAATLEIATNGPRQNFWASVAKFRAADAYAQVAGDALQMHGGIGMTWEFDLHYWLKRAKLNQVLYGNSDSHRSRVASEPQTT